MQSIDAGAMPANFHSLPTPKIQDIDRAIKQRHIHLIPLVIPAALERRVAVSKRVLLEYGVAKLTLLDG